MLPSYIGWFPFGYPAMADEHLISGLKQLRGETLCRVADIDKQLEALELEREIALAALEHVDGVLLLKEPGIKLEAIKARRPKGSCVTTRADGRRVPVTQAILKLLRVRDVSMSVDDIVTSLRPDYPSKDGEKLRQNVRMFLSSKKRMGILQGAPNDKGVLAYGFAVQGPVALPRRAA